MKIFIWKMYGNIRVYAVDTVQQIERVVKLLSISVSGWGLDEAIGEATEIVSEAKEKNSLALALQAILVLTDAVGVGSHEVLEHGSCLSKIE